MAHANETSTEIRNVISNVKKFVEKEKSEGQSIMQDNVMGRLEVATGISRGHLYRLLKHNKKSRRKAWNKIELDDFDIRAITRKIHQFYQQKEFPTTDKLLAVLRSDLNFTGGRSTLWRILKKLGFTFKKQDGRKFLIEKPAVVMLRHEFLKKMKKLRATKPSSKIIYLDETWINENHTVHKCWLVKDGKGGFPSPLGKGKRLIVVHAGSTTGFVPHAKLNFVSKTNSSDYHDEMNSKHFEEWLETKVFPNIPEGSTVVMDNASYHSVRTEKAPNSQ